MGHDYFLNSKGTIDGVVNVELITVFLLGFT